MGNKKKDDKKIVVIVPPQDDTARNIKDIFVEIIERNIGIVLNNKK